MDGVERRRDAVAASWESGWPTGTHHQQLNRDHMPDFDSTFTAAIAANGSVHPCSRVDSDADQIKQAKRIEKKSNDRLRAGAHQTVEYLIPREQERALRYIAFEAEVREFSNCVESMQDVFDQEGDRQCLKREYARILMQGLSASSLTMRSSGVVGRVPTEQASDAPAS